MGLTHCQQMLYHCTTNQNSALGLRRAKLISIDFFNERGGRQAIFKGLLLQSIDQKISVITQSQQRAILQRGQ